MSTFGREADEYARKIREIKKGALQGANRRPTISLTDQGNIRLRQGEKTIYLEPEEARDLASAILTAEAQ